jgi:hypothetical protein
MVVVAWSSEYIEDKKRNNLKEKGTGDKFLVLVNIHTNAFIPLSPESLF